MIADLLKTPVTIHRSGTASTDAEGNVTYATDDVVTVGYGQPLTTEEQIEGQLRTAEAWRWWFPQGTVVAAPDTFSAPSGVFAVEGDPMPWAPPTGDRDAHVEVRAVLR